MLKVIDEEAPIEVDLLLERVLDSVGLSRKNAENEMFDILDDFEYKKIITTKQNTIFKGKAEELTQVRISKEADRPFNQIPKEELGSAVMDLLRINQSQTREAIIKDITKEIYKQRNSEKIESKMDEVFEYLLKNKLISEHKEKFSASS